MLLAATLRNQRGDATELFAFSHRRERLRTLTSPNSALTPTMLPSAPTVPASPLPMATGRSGSGMSRVAHNSRSFEPMRNLSPASSIARRPQDRHGFGGHDGSALGRFDAFNPRCAEHHGIVYAVAFNPEGSRLATGCSDNIVHLWDTETFDEMIELRGHSSYVHAVAFSPDGTMLASGSGDFTVRIWDSRSPDERRGSSN
jgi:WD40 repeat protein